MNNQVMNLSPESAVNVSAGLAEHPSFAQIQQWLTERIADLLKTQPTEIDSELPFSFYGLDSVSALGLSGDLESWLRRKLEPTLTWDYPTITQLSEYLAAL